MPKAAFTVGPATGLKSGLKARTVIGAGVITNLVSTSGSRIWHRMGVNERKGHEHTSSCHLFSIFTVIPVETLMSWLWILTLLLGSSLSPFSSPLFYGSLLQGRFICSAVLGERTLIFDITHRTHSAIYCRHWVSGVTSEGLLYLWNEGDNS